MDEFYVNLFQEIDQYKEEFDVVYNKYICKYLNKNYINKKDNKEIV